MGSDSDTWLNQAEFPFLVGVISFPNWNTSKCRCEDFLQMSKNYDNWERLVGAVLKRELLRQIALCDSSDSSIISTASSSFNVGSASPFTGYDEHGIFFYGGETLLPANDTRGSSISARISGGGLTSLIMWLAHGNDAGAVREMLEKDPSLVNARNYDNRTPLHVAAIQGWLDVAKCLLEFKADVNAQDRWNKTPLADAEGAKKYQMIELLKSYGGLSYDQNASHFEARAVPPSLPKKYDWEIEPPELDFSNSALIGKGSSGEILKASWRGTPVAVKRILPKLSNDRLAIRYFRNELNLLVKLRHPNIVEFLGAVTEGKPLMLITEYLRGGDLRQYLKEKGALNPYTAIKFALDIARGMAYLHREPNVFIHRGLQPRNILLVNSSADRLKVGDFGLLTRFIRMRHSHDVYNMIGSYRYMAPEVFKHQKYDKKVDVFSFAMIFYEMLEGEPPLDHYEPYDAARCIAAGHRPTLRAKGLIPELRELIQHCWAADMNQRPSFLEILRRLEEIKEMLPSDHRWFIFAS